MNTPVPHALLSELTADDARMDALEATDVATDARLDTVEASVYLPGPLVLASNAPVSLNRHADYRCTGANDHVTVQAAVDAAGTAPAYLSDGTFAFAGGVLKTAQANAPGGLVGTSRNGTVITQADDSAYVYAWESSLTSGSGAELSGPLFEKLDIRSKFGIKLGQTGVDFTTVWKLQAFLMGAKFRDLRMLGKYSAAADPNADTDNDATSAELLGYGAGISAAKCFQLLVTNCLISTFGIGAYIDGCDIAEIAQGTRLIGNARGAHFYGHDTYGGKPKVDHCDVVAQRRKGAIRFEDVVAWQISGNTYFENTLGARCYVWESGATSRDSEFSGNYVVGSGATQPWAIFSPRNHVVSNNRANGTVGPTQVDTAAYSQQNPVLMRWVDNDPALPAPTTGLVNSRSSVDPYLLSVDNCDPGNVIFGTLPTAEFPWYTSPVTARQVIKPTNPTLKWRVPLRHRAHRAFEIRYTGRFLSGVADAQTVSYVEDATTTMTTGAGTLGFSKTDDVETLSQFVTLPATEEGDGYFEITVQNDRVEFERIEIVPLPHQPLQRPRSVQIVTLNGAYTLLPTKDPEHTIHTGPLSANRAVTLSTTNAIKGCVFRITRTAASTGAFTLDVGPGPLKSLATSTWAEFLFDGTNWILSEYGAL
jgi:hypothetical protein